MILCLSLVRRFFFWSIPVAWSVGGVANPAPTAVLTASGLKRVSVEELLHQEVVSVSRRGEAWATAPSNVFLIAPASPAMTGALTLRDLLRTAPNLFVAQSSSFHWGANARGFIRTDAHSNKLLVLVDGRPVYPPLYSNVFWGSTDIFLAEGFSGAFDGRPLPPAKNAGTHVIARWGRKRGPQSKLWARLDHEFQHEKRLPAATCRPQPIRRSGDNRRGARSNAAAT